MNQLPPTKRLEWDELGVLAMLGAMFALGLFFNWRSLWDALLTVGFAIVLLFGAWETQRLFQQASSTRRKPDNIADRVGGRPQEDQQQEKR